MMDAQILFGRVFHCRRRPVRHAFAYGVFFLRVPLSAMARAGRGIFSVDARTYGTLTTSQWETVTDFRTHSVHLGPGTHTLTWQRPWVTPDRRLVLESVSHQGPRP